MYELTDVEYERYMSCHLFRQACDCGYKNGFSKEQMLSRLLIYILEMKDAEDKRKLDKICLSLKPGSIITGY